MKMVFSIMIGLVVQSFAPKPKPATAPETGRRYMLRASSEPHQIPYGECMVSGPIVVVGTSR
jgi:hypothetical protein